MTESGTVKSASENPTPTWNVEAVVGGALEDPLTLQPRMAACEVPVVDRFHG